MCRTCLLRELWIVISREGWAAAVDRTFSVHGQRETRDGKGSIIDVNIVSRTNFLLITILLNREDFEFEFYFYEFTNSRMRERERERERRIKSKKFQRKTNLWKKRQNRVLQFRVRWPWSTNEFLVYTLDWIRNSATRLDVGSIITWDNSREILNTRCEGEEL